MNLTAAYTPPDLGIGARQTTYAYNLDQQLTVMTRPDGQTLTVDYDTGGRVSTLTELRGQTSFTYHPTTGKLAGITAPDGGTLAYAYDGSLLTGVTWAGAVAGSVGWTYNTDFQVTTERINGGTPITFTYDPDRLLTGAGALTLTRNPQHGLLTGSTLGNVTDSYTYSTFGEVSAYQATYSGTPQLATQYTRDILGRITQKTETLAGVTDTYAYTYDTVGRLTDVTKYGVAAAHYEYDGNGNRLSVTRPVSGTVSGTYDAQDRLTAYGAVSYTYTANGDLQTATSGGQTTTYSYDVSGNLLAVTLPTGTQIAYVIDGQNRRIGKKVNGTLVQGFLYNGRLRPVAELDGSGAVVSRFVYGTKVNVPDYFVKGGVTYRIVTDHLGSPRLVINASTGAVAQRMDYDEFGQITQDTNPAFQPFGFAGGLYDPDTKLTRFGARDYDAFTGRWTAKDPIRFGGLDPNLYAYVGNDSLDVLDPSGLMDVGRMARGGLTALVGAAGILATAQLAAPAAIAVGAILGAGALVSGVGDALMGAITPSGSTLSELPQMSPAAIGALSVWGDVGTANKVDAVVGVVTAPWKLSNLGGSGLEARAAALDLAKTLVDVMDATKEDRPTGGGDDSGGGVGDQGSVPGGGD